MPTNYTKNYRLNQWEPSDKVLRADFNADNARIDAGLAEKADATTVEALSQTVANHAASLAGKGNCRIYTTSYTGSGTYGSGAPNSLAFPGRPALVFIGESSDGGLILWAAYGQPLAWSHGDSHSFNNITWRGNTMTWYAGFSATGQMNKQGVRYTVVALMEA